MSNSGLITVSASKDITARACVAKFAASGTSGSAKSGNARFATHVTLTAGEQPSYAFVAYPVKGRFPSDEQAIRLALQKGGPAGKILLRTRCAIEMINGKKTSPLLCGNLLTYHHILGTPDAPEDSLLGLVMDDRWWLSKITTFGAMCYDPGTAPGTGGTHYFDAGRPLIFNMNGWPDCIDTPYGPRFAPSYRFGHKAFKTEGNSEPVKGKATTTARSWTGADAMTYLRDYAYDYSRQPAQKVNYGGNVLSQNWIIWPETLGDIVGSARTMKHVSLENQTLLRALTTVLRKCGAYELFMVPREKMKSEMTVVNMNPSRNSGIQMILPSYDTSLNVGDLINSANAIQSGYVTESIVNHFDTVCICGDPPAVEKFVSMTTATDSHTPSASGSPTGEGVMLEAAWPAADLVLLNAFINENASHTIADAQRLYPHIFTAYRIPRAAKIWKGTKWEKVGQSGPYPRFRPFLLTGDQSDSTNPRTWAPKPIIVEQNSLADGTGTWSRLTLFDELTLTPDGQTMLLPVTTNYIISGSFPNIEYKALPLRMSVALEGDFRITGIAGHEGDQDGDPNNTVSRIAPLAPGEMPTNYLAVAEPLDYVEWLRYKSFPAGHRFLPTSERDRYYTGGANGDKAGLGNADTHIYTDRVGYGSTTAISGRLPDHARARLKDVKRIEYTGQIMQRTLNCALKPGDGVTIESGDTIPTFSVVKSISLDCTEQQTTIELGAADAKEIYDIPLPGQSGKPAVRFSANEPEREYPEAQRKDDADEYLEVAGSGQPDRRPELKRGGIQAALREREPDAGKYAPREVNEAKYALRKSPDASKYAPRPVDTEKYSPEAQERKRQEAKEAAEKKRVDETARGTGQRFSRLRDDAEE